VGAPGAVPTVGAWFDYIALALNVPGWFIVTMIRGDAPGTQLTDVLIPVLSGILWVCFYS
jgi:hypothetical protein